ncbi:hybrid sensor histidine kinase/response regulator [Polluticoccus soli]|uniref:hybrid sensor histidine kinase/response regulator n=1 Tax=Polluticoccus soli TaxID=3034150 RepID=UPI0023E0B200|nr:hybrid sensor histidine kinase/response regulator [Flavipsychrobacter sp. JY13-12]
MSAQKKIKVLYIDDEMNNLISFKASFRFDYNVLVANSTAEAREHLEKNNDISVILCDQRMPDKTGVEFYEEIREHFPNPVRILITGYTDIESVIDAINRGHIFRYIKKPWTDVDVKSAIDEAHKFYVTTSMLAVKNEELQKAYNELDKFAYSATHDMRGPILSVLGIINLAEESDDITEVKDMLSMMEKAMMKLDTYIQNLHDYYNIRRGELNIAEVNFAQVVKDMRDMFEITSRVEHVAFETEVKQEETFRSDETSLKIVLNNLLSNAFKYQKKNTAGDKVVRLKIEVSKGTANIFVSDNGIGIPEVSIGQIFNMFYRAANDELGSGFGLYNVKDALNKVSGNIEVESEVNKGTTFKVTLPSK